MKLSPTQARALSCLAEGGDLFVGGIELPRRTVSLLSERGVVRVHPGGTTTVCPRSGCDVFTPGPSAASLTAAGWAALGRAPTWPRWVRHETDGFDPVLLREVGHELFVGSSLSHHWLRRPNLALVQLYIGCPEVRAPSLRRAINDGTHIDDELLDEALAFVREQRPRRTVLIQCQAGLSRSASVAAALLIVLDGLSPDEARSRIAVPEWSSMFPRAETLSSALAWAERTRANRASAPAPQPTDLLTDRDPAAGARSLTPSLHTRKASR